MQFACTSCSRSMTCPDSFAGRKASCPKCGQKLKIPPAPDAPSAPTNQTTLGQILPNPFDFNVAATPTRPAPPPSPPAPAEDDFAKDIEITVESKRKPELVTCPFCQGDIPRGVVKCRHCGETIDAGVRALEEGKREAALLADGTDVFGVLGLIIGLFSVAGLPLVCCWGFGALVVVPLGVAGGGCSLFGRGNLRVAGLALNAIAIFVGILLGAAVFLIFAMALADHARQFPR